MRSASVGYQRRQLARLWKEIAQIEKYSRESVRQAAHMFCDSSPEMPSLLAALQTYRAIPHKQRTRTERACAGKLLESITALAFAGLRGVSRMEQVKTKAAEYDLVVSGSRIDPSWDAVCRALKFKKNRDTILVEVKAIRPTVSDAQFLRFCALIDAHFKSDVGLGVFVTLNGASGFPGTPKHIPSGLRDAYMHHALYYARRRVPVVVLRYEHVMQLGSAGALLNVLVEEIYETKLLAGRKGEAPSNCPVVPTQPHLYLARRFLDAGDDAHEEEE